MSNPELNDSIAVIGAGVIGCAVAWNLVREGRSVILIDPDEPGRAGASYGNAGHIASELIEPVPSPSLLFGFWKQLAAFDGPLSFESGFLPGSASWLGRFVAAAFRHSANTQILAPLVRASTAAFHRALREVGQVDLLKLNGHYSFWTEPGASKRAQAEAQHMAALGIPTMPVDEEFRQTIAATTGSQHTTGLWFPETAHVLDPMEICAAFARAAIQGGATFRKTRVRAMAPREREIEVLTDDGTVKANAAVVCAGIWSESLLKTVGLRAPLKAARGYHVELPGHTPLTDAPIVYTDQTTVVTPMVGRLRATNFVEFTSPDAPPDPRKPRRLRRKLQRVGYNVEADGPSWMGSRPVLPDYLPGIGRAPGPRPIFYAVGHQHIGLTLAAVTGEIMADLIAGRTGRHDIAPFDLRRFGAGGH
ncbi:MAG: FAD-binding oxidoreductase [Proteobacteria bacterium]|nr:FAD-binding oxidoreductase [Pseudomonadota bacterium]